MLQILVVMNEDVASRSASRDEPDAEPQPDVEPAEPEAEDGPDDGSNQLPENVPDDWLDGDNRPMYVDYLLGRLKEPRAWVEEAERARGEQ